MLKRTLVEAGLSRANTKEKMTKFSTYRPAILFALAWFLSLVCANQTKAQATITLNTGNTAVAGDAGPYAMVTITLDSSTTATVTFNSLTNGGFIYLMGDGGTADLNVNGTTSSTYSTTGYASGGPITVAPEPKSMLLFGTGLLVIGGILRRRRSLKT